MEKVDFNAYNDNDDSTDEEALEAAIIEEARKMRPMTKHSNTINRNQFAATKSECAKTPRVRRLFNLKNLQHQDQIRRNKSKNSIEQYPSRKEFYEHLNKARYRRQ